MTTRVAVIASVMCLALANPLANPLESRVAEAAQRGPSSELARLFRTLRRHDDALAVHQAMWRALEGTGGTAGQYVTLAVELATDLIHAYAPERAEGLLHEVITMLGADLPPDMGALLRRMQARAADCRGDFAGAVAHMAAGTAAGALAASPRDHLDALVNYRLYLRRRPSAANDAEETRVAALIRALGPWRTEWQTPHEFDPALDSRPWLALTAVSPAVQEAARLLEAAAPALLQEFDALDLAGQLDADQDCLQHGPTAKGRGWLRFEPASVRHADVHTNAHGCSISVSPVACALLRQLRAVPGLTVLRGGYSAVGSQTWLKPHFAATNRQLKLHVGLRTPLDPATGAPCATMRVGNESKAWHQGRVLVFDDSFEHEVHNSCPLVTSESGACDLPFPSRVVFQLVIRHPGVPSSRVPEPARLVVDALH